MFEQDLPGENSAGFNKAGRRRRSAAGNLPDDQHRRGATTRRRPLQVPRADHPALLGAAGRGANLLLNVGPRPDGTIGPEFTERLLDGRPWLESNGAGRLRHAPRSDPAQPWGVSLASRARGRPVYLHVLKPDVPVRLPGASRRSTPGSRGRPSH